MKDALLFILFIVAIGVAVTSVIVLPIVVVHYHKESCEIIPREYRQVRDWTKDFPQLIPMVKEAKWSDDIISRSEFKEIGKAADKVESEQYFQEAIGE